ncbi:hypothetical protein ET495_07070 [Xylanimonas allomyrinae]|uniref:Uncharacterized protein n=1 Tax=Xylanimonas allomyrinae TaxID=2509459 RepID=A0A4P6EKV6_9MICO|nr:hypothetical protein [Xylanimonas allomyrinae]QAY63045.1 hypothetical protein ET495_07070 [Xylanimonas allomyrinae]
MTDAVTTTERSPRRPFAGVPARDLVRDVVAAVALLTGVVLPWTAQARGSDRIEVVLATIVALLAVVVPYARRAELVTATWAADERRTRSLGVIPLAVVAVAHLVRDVLPGGLTGIGIGLGIGLAGAVLAAEIAWPRLVLVVAGVLALGAVASPVLDVVDAGFSAWRFVGVVLTSLLALGVLWLTVWRLEHGDHAAGVLLVGLGVVIALAGTLLGGQTVVPWVESVDGGWFGIVLLPVMAAAAVPRVVGHAVEAGAQARQWADAAVLALVLALALGGYVALIALTWLIDSGEDGVSPSSVLRLVFGIAVAVVAFFAYRALRRDVATGHATAVGAALVIATLGVVLIVVRAGASTRTSPVDVLLAFGLPAIVLSVLLVPRSLRELRVQAPQAAPEADAPVTAEPPADPEPPAAGVAAAPPGGVHAAGGSSPAPLEPDPTQTVVLATSSAPAVAPTAAPGAAGGPAGEGEPADPSPPAQAPVPEHHGPTGPFGVVGATQVLPAVGDMPDSRWTAAHAIDPGTPLADLALIVQEAPHLRPLVAANPSTYPALLDWLGALGDPQIDAALRARG